MEGCYLFNIQNQQKFLEDLEIDLWSWNDADYNEKLNIKSYRRIKVQINRESMKLCDFLFKK